MPSRVLLISSNQCDSPYAVFPLGLSYLDAVLRKAGHQTHWLDLHFMHGKLEKEVGAFRPDVIGISLRNIDDVVINMKETYFDSLPALVEQLRTLTPAPIVLGGSGFSIFPNELLEFTGADFGIQGEGEGGFLELIHRLECGQRGNPGIAGLYLRAEGKITSTPGSPCKDAFSACATRPNDIAQYYLEKSSILNLQTQRGCAFRCCYCTYPLIEGRAYRRAAPECVADEFVLLKERGAKYVFLVDSVFNSSTSHVRAVCEALISRRVDLPWGCFLRPAGLTAPVMELMAEAGLSHIEFGSDSFCDSVLQRYGKAFTFSDVLVSSELAQKSRIDHCHFLVCGGPGETAGTLRETFENSKRLPGGVIMALPGMRIYPGTPLHQQAIEEGLVGRSANLLKPCYYRSPLISEEEIATMLRHFAQQSPNWIVGEPSPAYRNLVERLRAKGIVGPTWTYLAAMQRLTAPMFARSAAKIE